jgi:hypothetical protein
MSILIKIKNESVADLPYLTRLVLRYIYEKDNMIADEINLMEHSIIKWVKKLFRTREETYILQRMGWMLKKNKEGHFDKRKELFKEKNIDWRKFHRGIFYDRGNKRIY